MVSSADQRGTPAAGAACRVYQPALVLAALKASQPPQVHRWERKMHTDLPGQPLHKFIASSALPSEFSLPLARPGTEPGTALM